MSSMKAEISSLSSAEVCSIIEACSKGQVTSLKFQGLELKRETPVLSFAPNQYPVTEITESQHKQMTKESIEAAEIETREMQMRELALTDPLAFEEMLAKGELEGNQDDEYDDDGDLPTD